MSKCSAEIIIKIDGEYKEKVIRVSANSMKELKRKIYNASFIDVDGENAENLKQWKEENQIASAK